MMDDNPVGRRNFVGNQYAPDFEAIALLCKLGRPEEARSQAERLAQEAQLASGDFSKLNNTGAGPGTSQIIADGAQLATALFALPDAGPTEVAGCEAWNSD
jgi:hypothetical protein